MSRGTRYSCPQGHDKCPKGHHSFPQGNTTCVLALFPTIAMCRQPEAQPLQPKSCFLCLNQFLQMSFQQDNIQKILLSLTSRIAETHLAHEKRRILSMYRLFVLLLLKELPEGLGNTWAFFVRDVVYSLLRIISDGKQVIKRPRQQQQQVRFVADNDLFLPCCNLLYYVCKSAVECCSEVRTPTSSPNCMYRQSNRTAIQL